MRQCNDGRSNKGGYGEIGPLTDRISLHRKAGRALDVIMNREESGDAVAVAQGYVLCTVHIRSPGRAD